MSDAQEQVPPTDEVDLVEAPGTEVSQDMAVASSAEEAALHVLDEGLADFDSEVDDPDLESAWETDPEVGLGDR